MSACAPEDEVERDFWNALKYCHAQKYSAESQAALEAVMDRWLDDPRFQSDLSVRSITLNEITFLLLHEELGELARRKIRELTARTTAADENGVRVTLRISTFELAAEPPEVPEFLQYLFSMERDPATRWAVFDAYERWPGRFRKHIAKYSDGSITEKDYLEWLDSQGFTLTPKGIRRRG